MPEMPSASVALVESRFLFNRVSGKSDTRCNAMICSEEGEVCGAIFSPLSPELGAPDGGG